MPTWGQVQAQIASAGSQWDVVRRQYLAALHEITGRNVILYWPERFWANAIQISDMERHAIYERDGWECQICHEPVDRELDPQDRMAATLDHVVPRSMTLFPDDSPTNLRLAHRSCNSRRGNRAA